MYKNLVSFQQIMAELQQLITEIAANTRGVLGVVISDKDGVPVLKAAVDNNSPILDGCFRHQFLSVCSTLSEHANKMCLGPTLSITATFDDYQVVHSSHASLICTIVASDAAMTGQMMELFNAMKPLLSDMSKQIIPVA
jgi:mitogen-activated protein kinase kinase 1 interacting protein 1